MKHLRAADTPDTYRRGSGVKIASGLDLVAGAVCDLFRRLLPGPVLHASIVSVPGFRL